MEISLLKFLSDAQRAVPAVRYAVGIAGVAVVVSIIAGLKIDARIAIFGTVLVLGLMFILLVFSALAANASPALLSLAMFAAWCFMALSISTSTFLMTSYFFEWPRSIEAYFPLQNKPEIDACVAERIAQYQLPKNTSSEGGARASGPGIGGGRNTATEELCHSVGPYQEILSATTSNLTCHGGRCSVTSPNISSDKKHVCVTTTAWSESNSFGGGGSGTYRLNVEYRDLAGEAEINNYRAICSGLKHAA